MRTAVLGAGDRGAIDRINDHMFCIFATFLYVLGVTFAWFPALSGVERLLPPGVALMIVAVIAFFRQGRSVVSVSSAAVYSVIIFAAFPAIYAGLGLMPTRIEPSEDSLILVVNLNFVFLIGVLLACPSVPPAPNLNDRRSGESYCAPEVDRPGRWSFLAVVLFAIAFVGTLMGQGVVSSQAGLLAVLVGAVGAFWRKGRARMGSVMVLGLVGFGYAELIFSGFGRLVLAFIAIAVAMMASMRYRSWWVKLGIAVGTAPALVYMSYSRMEFLAETRDVEPSASDGIGSVVGPFISSAIISDAIKSGAVVPSLGATLVVAALFWVPRQLWAAKPPGFGREIVPVVQPHLVTVTEHSSAGTLVGEAVWNFGVPLAWVFLILVALLIRCIDRRLLHIRAGSSLPLSLFWIVCGASLVHLMWGGFFTQLSRVGVLAGVLLAVAAMKAALTPRRLERPLRSHSSVVGPDAGLSVSPRVVGREASPASPDSSPSGRTDGS